MILKIHQLMGLLCSVMLVMIAYSSTIAQDNDPITTISEDGALRFGLPRGWSYAMSGTSIIGLATSSNTLSTAPEDFDQLSTGEILIVITLLDGVEGNPLETLETMVERLNDPAIQFLQIPFSIGPLSETQFQDVDVALAPLSSQSFDGLMITADVGAIFSAVVFTTIGNLPEAEIFARQIIGSLRYRLPETQTFEILPTIDSDNIGQLAVTYTLAHPSSYRIDQVAFGLNNRMFAIASYKQGDVIVFDSLTGEIESQSHIADGILWVGLDTENRRIFYQQPNGVYSIGFDSTELAAQVIAISSDAEVAYDTNKSLLAISMWDGVYLVDLTVSKFPITNKIAFFNATSLAFHPKREILAFGTSDGSVVLWDLRTNLEINRIQLFDDAVEKLVFDREGTQLAIVSISNKAKLFAVTPDYQMLVDSAEGYFRVNDISFNATGTCYSISGEEHLINFVDATSDKVAANIQVSDQTKDIEFSPDGKLLIVANAAGLIRVWAIPDLN
ncbi:MAG: hypothetical protein DPW16_07990 [Chloroflexi bacterium]|nr:hypothetical protein [Chloroflexota bacterium]